ncbi:hypothetical protein T439DRAFT_326985 [Meredithblackwellia eburnea MCA 4105]
MGDRSSLMSSAISFLRDPSTSNSPLAQKIAFLESKGLSQDEISHAMAVAGNGAPGPAPMINGNGTTRYPGMALQRQQQNEFDRDWRDWFIMAVVGGSVGWVAVKLAQKFLLPHLTPPTTTDLDSARLALEAKYDEASALLTSLQTSTDSLSASLEEQRESVEKELTEVREAVRELREGEKKREKEWDEIRKKVEEMEKGLPKMLETQSTSSSHSLSELQTELKSLKSLLIARRPTTPSPSSSPSPATTTSSTGGGLMEGIGRRTPGIPAWQLKGSATSVAAGSSSSPTTTTTVGGGLYANPPVVQPAQTQVQVQEEDPSASGVLVEKEDATAGEDKGKGVDLGSESSKTAEEGVKETVVEEK